LRLKKVEWRLSDYSNYIFSFRITLSDGSRSLEVGNQAVNQSYEFPYNTPIRKVEFKYYNGFAYSYGVCSLLFFGANN